MLATQQGQQCSLCQLSSSFAGKNKLQELWSKIKCCKKTHSESEDEGSDVERNMIPERQPQNTIVDEVPEDKQR